MTGTGGIFSFGAEQQKRENARNTNGIPESAHNLCLQDRVLQTYVQKVARKFYEVNCNRLLYFQKIAPAMVPVIMVAREAAIIARNPSFARSPCRVGAIPPIPLIWIAIELKFAKPHKEYVAIRIDFSLRLPAVFHLGQIKISNELIDHHLLSKQAAHLKRFIPVNADDKAKSEYPAKDVLK